MIKKVISVVLLVILTLLLLPSNVLSSGGIPITDFFETDPLSVFTSNASRVTYTAIKSGNQTQSFSKTVSDVAENSSFNYTWGWRHTAQSVSTGSSVLFIGFATNNITNGALNTTGNYSLGLYYYQTGAGILFRMYESDNGTEYLSSMNTSIGINDSKYFQFSRNETTNVSYVRIYNDSDFVSLNYTLNLTIHSKPAYTYMFFPVATNATTGITSMTGFIENLYREDTPETMTITTGYLTPLVSPFLQFGTINSTAWLGNVTEYGFRAGSANGTWDYTASTINYTDIYGTYNNTANGTFSTYFYNVSSNSTLYYQAYAAGYDSTGVYKTFYGSIRSFTNEWGAGTSSFTVATGNLTQLINPTTQLSSVLLSGSISSTNNPVTTWGFIVGYNSSSVSNISVASIQISHTGTMLTPVFSDFYDYSTNYTEVFARAFAINSNGEIRYGDIVSTNVTFATDPIITLASPTIIGKNVVLYALLDKAGFANQAGFSYGTTNDTTTFTSVITVPNVTPIYSIQSGWITLQAGTTYYYRGQIYTDHWIYSEVGNFTTSISTNITASAPLVVTYPANNITSNSFDVSVWIDGGNLTSVGIQIMSANDTSWTTVTIPASVGGITYNLTISGLSPENTYTFRGYGENIFGVGYGKVYSVTTFPITYVPPQPTIPGVTGTAVDFGVTLKNTMQKWGMDNTLGHWSFALILMIIEALVFGAFIIGTKDDLIKKILVLILGLCEIVTLGAFMFSGFLGTWAIGVMVIIAVALIIILGGKLLNRGEL